MTRRSRIGVPGLMSRHYGSEVASSVLVALLIAIVVLIVALAPRAISGVATAELRSHLEKQPALARDIGGNAQLNPFPEPQTGQSQSAATMFQAIDSAVEKLAILPEPLESITGEPDWFVTMAPGISPYVDPTNLGPVPQISLVIDLDSESRVDFIEGAAPAAWAGSTAVLNSEGVLEIPPLEIAISDVAAELMGLTVGDELVHPTAVLQVSGIYEPMDPNDAYWSHATSLQIATLTTATDQLPSFAAASVYVSPDSSSALRRALAFSQLVAWIPVSVDRLDYADAVAVAAQTRTLLGAGINLPTGETVRFHSQLANSIDEVAVRIASLSALLALMASGPLGVAVAVFALGAQSVIARRRSMLALAAARGASPLQIRLVMLIEGLLLAVPGAVLAIVVAGLLLPARVGPEAVIVPAIVALTVPVLFAGIVSPRGLGSTRSDLSSRSRSRLRGVVEITVVGLAALSIFLLARRGLVESSAAVGIDPLLAAAPLLLAGAACVLVLRVYPIPLAALQRGMRSRRDAVGLLGAARAIRDPALGFPATLALVVGMSVAVFSSVMGTTVSSALATTARETVGADIRVEAYNLDGDVPAQVADVAGVADVVTLGFAERIPIGPEANPSLVTFVFADTDALRAVDPNLPLGLDTVSQGAIPIIVSDSLGTDLTADDLTVNGQAVVIAGTLPPTTIPSVPRLWILVDSAFSSDLGVVDLQTDMLLIGVDPEADTAAVAESVHSVVVGAQREALRDSVRTADAATELADARSAPLIAGLEISLLLALLISAALCVVTVVVASVSASARRNRTIGILRTLGMSPRQTAGLMAWEIGPVAITAAIAGAALGLVLPWIVTSALDLRPFVGGFNAPVPDPDPVLIVIVVLGFLAVAAIAGLLATAIGRRLHPAGILKMGAE